MARVGLLTMSDGRDFVAPDLDAYCRQSEEPTIALLQAAGHEVVRAEAVVSSNELATREARRVADARPDLTIFNYPVWAFPHFSLLFASVRTHKKYAHHESRPLMLAHGREIVRTMPIHPPEGVELVLTEAIRSFLRLVGGAKCLSPFRIRAQCSQDTDCCKFAAMRNCNRVKRSHLRPGMERA